jgi:uncharacterized protein (TIGR02271 family)
MPSDHRPDPDPAPDRVEVVRREEELSVERVRVPRERLRLRKRIVTEPVTLTVELRREELVVEREPIREGEEVVGRAIDDAPLEIVLHTEEPVVATRVVAVERVRVVKQTVVEERELVDELRKEQVVVEGSAPVERRGEPLT